MTGLGWQTGERQNQDVNPDLSDASLALSHQLRSRVGSKADAPGWRGRGHTLPGRAPAGTDPWLGRAG